MDYSKSGNANLTKKHPKHSEHNQHGTAKTPFGARPSREDLLARMKAAAEAKKAEGQ